MFSYHEAKQNWSTRRYVRRSLPGGGTTSALEVDNFMRYTNLLTYLLTS